MARTKKGPDAVQLLPHSLHAPEPVKEFQNIVLHYYRTCGRRLPWRTTRDPYAVFVSEVMLQQTQVDRVIPKYSEFLEMFPDVDTLARAALKDILAVWQGMGYNRRAIALQKSAREIVSKHGGRFPRQYEQLLLLPGIGPYTASAICVFSFNQPRIFIETNIRTVYIYCFFPDGDAVSDKDILPLVEKTLYKADPRTWYNALMDYGVLLKRLFPNPGRNSAQYQKQSPFQGSDRQIRGLLLKQLIGVTGRTEKTLIARCGNDAPRVRRILSQLLAEGFVSRRGGKYGLS